MAPESSGILQDNVADKAVFVVQCRGLEVSPTFILDNVCPQSFKQGAEELRRELDLLL